MALITLSDVTIAFEGVAAVEHVSYQLNRGDYMVMVGENGSGKSTLVRAMLGLVHPRSGSISYGDGLQKNQIGYLPQQTAAQRDFPASVEEVVLSGCSSSLKPWQFFYNHALVRRAHEKMEMLDIMALKDKSYRTLSGGQQQRTLLARALCATDSLLILDEPVTGLDPASMEEFYALIRRLNREYGVSIVMVSHDVRSAMKDANKVLVVDKGVSFCGTLEEYRKNSCICTEGKSKWRIF